MVTPHAIYTDFGVEQAQRRDHMHRHILYQTYVHWSTLANHMARVLSRFISLESRAPYHFLGVGN